MIDHDGPSLADLLDFERRIAEPLNARLETLSESWPLPGKRLRASAVGKVVDRVRGVFAVPLYKVLAAGWRMHPGCRAFCDRHRYPPGEAHVMELAEHTLGWECEPAVELVMEGLAAAGAGKLAELNFEVEIETAIRTGVLTIQDARFVTMDAGALALNATLRLHGFTIARYEVPVDLPGTVRFGADGEPICPVDEPAAADERTLEAPGRIAVPAIMDPGAADSGIPQPRAVESANQAPS
ncbi:MAG TPA: hypothetical protein VFR37_03495 [Longimicrobium sp.]|nr:hypothetical protein [Longimicrobium sp.]